MPCQFPTSLEDELVSLQFCITYTFLRMLKSRLIVRLGASLFLLPSFSIDLISFTFILLQREVFGF